jgi:hypothetical protein
MHGFENLIILHPQCNEIIDIEETSPIDEIASRPPPGEPVMLVVQQSLKTLRLPEKFQRFIGKIATFIRPQRKPMLRISDYGSAGLCIRRDAYIATHKRFGERSTKDRE